MTGYGTYLSQRDGRTVAVEVRTVNHRFLDLHFRLPRDYGFLEPQIAKVVRRTLMRGRVDLSVSLKLETSAELLLNMNAARSHVEAAGRLKDEFHFSDALDLRTLMLLPGVLQAGDISPLAEAWSDQVTASLVLECVAEALKSVLRMRLQEGNLLAGEMRQYLERIAEHVAGVHGLIPAAVDGYQEQLRTRLAELLAGVQLDPQRLAAEVAILAEKTDIREELTRLESHVRQALALLETEGAVGKDLDFLMQEMQREANTVLSKTASLEMKRLGLEIKADVERLREQTQNIE